MILGAPTRLCLFMPVLVAGLQAAEPRAASPLETSLGATLGYDDNVFAVGAGPLGKRESAFAVASARIAFSAPPGLSIAYAPSATRFFDERREDNLRHALSASIKGAAAPFSWSAATEFAYVQGDERGVDYGPGYGSAFSTAAPRERREQWTNKSDLALRIDGASGFVRGVGKLQYWDMLTTAVGAPGATVNYVDRHDVSGGLDLGRALRPGGPEAYVGYRRGYQFQDRDARPDLPRSASNHYDRALLGLDGNIGKTLKITAQAGWAWHAYSENPAVYAGSPHEEGLFTDLRLTWSQRASDELQLKTCQGRTFSSTGTNSLLATTHQLAWKHHFNARWSTTLGASLQEAEYSPAARDDLDYSLAATLTHNFDAVWSCAVSVSHDRGRNHDDAIVGATENAREFDRNIVSLSLTWKR